MKSLNIVMCVGSLLISCGIASAGSCIDTCVTYSSSTTPITELDYFGSAAYGTPYAPEYISLPVFDTNLGTLTSATISITTNTGTNNDSTSGLFGKASQFVADATGQPDTVVVEQIDYQMYLLNNPLSCTNAVTSTPGSEASVGSSCHCAHPLNQPRSPLVTGTAAG